MDLWRFQYYVEGNSAVAPVRPPTVRDIIDQKKKISVKQDNYSFVDRGIGTMCDTIDIDALSAMSQSLWTTNDEISLR